MKQYKSIYNFEARNRRGKFEPTDPRHGSNKKMDSEVYKLRREVMNYVYEAKALTGGTLPRINVRITEKPVEDILGLARMNQNLIWIPEETILSEWKPYLKQVVFHELLHAAYNVEHDESSPLMSSIISKPLKSAEIDKWFLHHIENGPFA